MSDIMRQEFEDWVSRQKVCVGRGATLEKNECGEYFDFRMNARWRAWKASRAAMCVYLPKQWLDEELDCDLMKAHEVTKALDRAGVRYK